MEQDGEKSQEPTQHRREQARGQGQIARSQDLASAALLLGGLVTVLWLGSPVMMSLGRLTRHFLGGGVRLTTDVPTTVADFAAVIGELAPVVLPLLCLMLAVVVAANVAQLGLLFLPEKLMPDLTRLDPIQGFHRVFSLASVVRLVFGLFKVGLVAAVAYACLSGEFNTLLALIGLSPPQIGQYISESLLWTGIKIASALLLLALFDYGFQWWRQEQDLRMTTQEVREEMKNLQGDPQVIARRRAAQRQLILNRLSSTVPKADVVITNPTELAIAVQYDPDEMAAPIVVAKGAGLLAQRIRRLALENGIPIVEKKPLAQALYKDVEINHPIPAGLYAAVAEVLAYVYQLQGKTMARKG